MSVSCGPLDGVRGDLELVRLPAALVAGPLLHRDFVRRAVEALHGIHQVCVLLAKELCRLLRGLVRDRASYVGWRFYALHSIIAPLVYDVPQIIHERGVLTLRGSGHLRSRLIQLCHFSLALAVLLGVVLVQLIWGLDMGFYISKRPQLQTWILLRLRSSRLLSELLD